MDILAAPPFVATSLLWQPRPDSFMLTVICKATFDLLPGMSALAPEQDLPNETDDYWNDDERRSLHAASDRVPFKRRADVVVIGHAYAPGSVPVSSLVVRLVVGSVDKAIEVNADRAWTQEGQLREKAPFLKMPLRWERAAGGPETSNPVGVRADARPDMYGQVMVPNLQPPGSYVARLGEPIAPIGLGPIAPSWPARRAMLHRHAGYWNHRTWFERPLPEDIDAAFFNVAPADQQVDELRSDERLVLENLHAEHPRLVTSLPGLSPRAVVERFGAGAQAVRLRCDTLCIDTDRGVCSLVWRGQVPLSRADEPGRVMISAEGGERVDTVATVEVGELRPATALPFGGSLADVQDAAVQTIFASTPVAVGPALPFQKGGSPWSAAALAMAVAKAGGGAAERGEDDGTGTLFGTVKRVADVLPFAGSMQEEPLEQPTARLVLPMQAALPRVVEALPAPIVEPEPVRWEKDDEEAGTPTVAPPAMIGPLATAEMADRETAPKAEEPVAPVEETAPMAAEPEPADLPIERVAEIQAEIAEERAPRAEVLREHELTEEVWAATERHWARAIEEEAGRGASKLRRASDAAYVAAVERFRGAITGEEYARIMIGLERGRANQELDALRIQRPALMRIVRIWTKKVAGDVRLGKEVRGVMAGMREG
jgi:hypothetical protein